MVQGHTAKEAADQGASMLCPVLGATGEARVEVGSQPLAQSLMVLPTLSSVPLL